MTAEQIVRRAIAKTGVRMTDIAKAFGVSDASFSVRMKRQTLRERDMRQIAEVLGATYHAYLEFPDGERIGE